MSDAAMDIEMSHDVDGARYLTIRDAQIDGDVRIVVAGMPVDGSWWKRLRVALAIVFRPGTIRSVNIAVMSGNIIGGRVTVDAKCRKCGGIE